MTHKIKSRPSRSKLKKPLKFKFILKAHMFCLKEKVEPCQPSLLSDTQSTFVRHCANTQMSVVRYFKKMNSFND